MASQVVINFGYGIIPPFSGIVCNVYGNECQYVGSGNAFPITFTLPSEFNTAPAVQITLVDSQSCSVTEIFNCLL